MTMPTLKRIKVATEQELRHALAKEFGSDREVMIVTSNAKSRDKHISSELVREAARENGWQPGRSYTLSGNLLGHVVSRS
ncbi:hypothetical protein [Cognatishimia sp. F0-27]|uniref:hypothetical protein n=1 Tax=Cognatishimia sp. F0-27 TaxID=2816855 RepID=UPI001D0CB1B6|nr:hypothetical protein [Cognatishimia sp. F0-27]MCC1494014.1 hypothetical protein [Cognatishimia sp. F0-27]